MYKIAVMGGADTVTGFKALGLKTFAVTEGEGAVYTLRKLAKSGEYAIIYVEENLVTCLSSEINKYRSAVTPAIILIPGRDGPLGTGRSALHDAVIRAVGADI